MVAATSRESIAAASYPSLEAASAHADKIASDLSKDRDDEGLTVVVTDEQGNEVAQVRIGEVF